jgi:Leucine Rich repeat
MSDIKGSITPGGGLTVLGTEGDQLGKVASRTDGPQKTETLASLVSGKVTVDFPGKLSLGELYVLDEDGKAKFLCEAVGSITVAEGTKLALYYSFDPTYGCSSLGEVKPDVLHSISFLGSDISDNELVHVGKLTGLREIDVSCTQIGDAGLSHLKDLKHLTKLNLASTKISNYGLSLIPEGAKLRELILDNTEIGDEALCHIAGFTNLKVLSLSFTEISDKGLGHLKGAVTLEKVRLNCTKITDAGLMYLSRLVQLKELWVRSAKVSYPGLVELTKWLPACEIII